MLIKQNFSWVSRIIHWKWLDPWLQVARSCCMNILLGTQRPALEPTSALCVERLEMIVVIWGNTWRAYTSLDHSDTLANIVRRNLTQKLNWTITWWECAESLWPRFRCDWAHSTFAGGDKMLYQYIVTNPEMGPNTHSCSICGKTGSSRSNLRMHIENIHFAGSFTHQCKFCEMTFSTRNLLYKHIKSHK